MEQNNEILSAVSLEIKYKPKMQRKKWKLTRSKFVEKWKYPMVYNTTVNEISAKLTTCSAAPVADNAARDVSLGALLQFKPYKYFRKIFFLKNNVT
jgi:hypothetical protein